MDTLADAFEYVESRRKTLDVYAAEDAVRSEFETQFSTRNVRLTTHSLPSTIESGFVVVRNAAGEFRGALGLDKLAAIVSPETHPPWELAESEVDATELFSFLDNTLFASFDRRQMLAVTREIEDRAWRADDGTLYVGFQRSAAFAAQTEVYQRFVSESGVELRLFVEDDWESEVDAPDGVDVVSDAAAEIGRFWFVVFDGGESALPASGLLAEERDPDRYRGFWTDDPEFVDGIASYLRSTYEAT